MNLRLFGVVWCLGQTTLSGTGATPPWDRIGACHSIKHPSTQFRLTPMTVRTSVTANSRQLKTAGTLQEPTPFKRPKRNGFISGSAEYSYSKVWRHPYCHIETLKQGAASIQSSWRRRPRSASVLVWSHPDNWKFGEGTELDGCKKKEQTSKRCLRGVRVKGFGLVSLVCRMLYKGWPWASNLAIPKLSIGSRVVRTAQLERSRQ